MKRNKFFIALTCGVAMVGLMATTALAANNGQETLAQIDASTNTITYSVDGGKTWSEKVPQEGAKDFTGKAELPKTAEQSYMVNADGSISTAPENAQGTGTVVRIDSETNKIEYSVDGGKTWSTEIPKEAAKDLTGNKELPKATQKSYIVNADGSISTAPENVKGTGTVVRIDSETNKIEYSVDGGKTWSTEIPKEAVKDLTGNKELPKAAQQSSMVNPDGSISNAPANAEGGEVLARISSDTNKAEYSVDGGKTWSTEKPADWN